MTLPVRVRQVSVAFGPEKKRRQVLSEVSLECPNATVTAIMGRSGAGKSTLLHVIAGIICPDSGEVFFGDKEVTALSEKKKLALRRMQVSMIFQQYNLIDTLTAQENITLAAELSGAKSTSAKKSAQQAVAAMELDQVSEDFPDTLSGGEQQRTAIGRALASSAPIVLADEPTGALDTKSGQQVIDALLTLAGWGKCVIVVTHDPIVAEQADKKFFLTDGILAPYEV